MKLAYIGMIKHDGPKPLELVAEHYLEGVGRFVKGGVIEMMTFHAETMADATRTPPGVRQSIEDKDKGFRICVYAHRTAGVSGVAITDLEYDSRVAHSLVTKVVDEFLDRYPRTAYANFTAEDKKYNKLQMPELKTYITKYQDPSEADNIVKIQRELDQTKDVLNKTIESVLQRGEKIDDLVAKSDGLSASSKMFYTQAKKQNSCCTVM